MEEQKEALSIVQKKKNQLSNIRLFLVLTIMAAISMGVANKQLVYFILTAVLVVLFIISLWFFGKLQQEQIYLKSKVTVLQRREARVQNTWSSFEEDGREYLHKDATVEHDLDVFGDSSLFQYICVAHTKRGKNRLAQMLTEKSPDFLQLKERQEAVEELLQSEEISLQLETYSHILGEHDTKKVDETWFDTFLSYMKSEQPLLPKVVYIFSFLLPITFFAAVIGTMLGKISIQYPIVIFSIQVVAAYISSSRGGDVTQAIYQFSRNIESYSNFLGVIENAQFKSSYLKQQQKILLLGKGVTKGLAKLGAVDEAFKIRFNIYIHVFLQGIFMWDVHCLRLIEQWKSQYGDVVDTWMDIIGEMEALLSLAVVGQNKDYCYPIFSMEKEPIYIAKDLYHPLIIQESAVKNSIHLKAETDVITGSNMSGKTTFLRSVGINLILAYAGAPVCASYLVVSKIKLFTSMRVHDDISRGISTFYAEVLRIKEMVEYSKEEKPMLCLIDEIFKGTNSADRIVGAKAIITGLNIPNAISLVSTHDFELCQLIEDKEVNGKNYHFEEYYKEGSIFFDYKLKQGRCLTTNAKHILRMTGLLPAEK